MVYADWEFYTAVYLGNTIAEADFPRLVARASEYIDDITRGLAKDYYNDTAQAPVAKAVCAVAEVMQTFEPPKGGATPEGRIIASEAKDGVSVSYVAPVDATTAQGQQARSAALYTSAADHLLRTGLLYRGVMMR